MRYFVQTGKLSPKYTSGSYRAGACLCVRPCVRAFVCGSVYVPLCAALCTSFVATYRARRQVETKLTSPVVIPIQVIHYFVCAPEMFVATLSQLLVMTLMREHVISLITLVES